MPLPSGGGPRGCPGMETVGQDQLPAWGHTRTQVGDPVCPPQDSLEVPVLTPTPHTAV